MLQSAQLNYLD